MAVCIRPTLPFPSDACSSPLAGLRGFGDDVSGVVAIVADRVLPVASLPNAALAFAEVGGRYLLGIGHGFRERGFDSPPAIGEVALAFRKGPKAVHVVRQDDPGVDAKRRLPADLAHCLAQRISLRHEQPGAAVAQIHREEIGGAGDPVASVIRHVREYARHRIQRSGATRHIGHEANGGLRGAPPALRPLREIVDVGRMQSAAFVVVPRSSMQNSYVRPVFPLNG